jgi:hypothetical protein
MKNRTIYILPLLLMIMIACSLGTNTGANPTEEAQVVSTPPDPVPVNLNDGLASLNSYEMTIIINSVGPDPAQSSTTNIESRHSSDADASYTNINSTSISANGGDPEVTDTTTYQIGNDQCSGNAEEWSWTSSTPAEAEMQGLITRMIGLTPLIDNPVFVGAETVNGIPTNHFNFEVDGLGASSGAVVNINQGDYWLAADGQYIVKYDLVLEMSMAANSEVLHDEISIELDQVNQPVSIAFPQGCLDVAPTPTPAPEATATP